MTLICRAISCTRVPSAMISGLEPLYVRSQITGAQRASSVCIRSIDAWLIKVMAPFMLSTFPYRNEVLAIPFFFPSITELAPNVGLVEITLRQGDPVDG